MVVVVIDDVSSILVKVIGDGVAVLFSYESALTKVDVHYVVCGNVIPVAV